MNKESCVVKCNVCECMHNAGCNCCSLPSIEITHEKTAGDVVSVPHFCKSFQKR